MVLFGYALIIIGVVGLFYAHEILAALKRQQGYQRSREGRIRQAIGKVVR